MLDKLGGVFAPRPSTGPHKLRESLPLVIILRNRLKYALTNSEVTKIVMQRTIKVDGKVRTDNTYPAGFMGMYSEVQTTGHAEHHHNTPLPPVGSLSKPYAASLWCHTVKSEPILNLLILRSQWP